MNNKEIKTILKLALIFWRASIIFWLLETTIFLIIEGWHIKATNPIEIYLDKIVSNMWGFALFLTICVCVYTLINLTKTKDYEKRV